MINDGFSGISCDIRKSLFVDDGELWERGKNSTIIQGKIQEAVRVVESWSYSWGFRFLVDKTKVVMFTREKIREAVVKMYDKQLEQVNTHFWGFYLM